MKFLLSIEIKYVLAIMKKIITFIIMILTDVRNTKLLKRL